jgi:hypothetical protein
MYVEMSHGNSLCRCLKQRKMSLFFLLQNYRTGWNRSWLGGVVSVGGANKWGKGVGERI